MIHIFHHNDPDGWCSAAIVLKYVAEHEPDGTLTTLHECRYGMEFPWDKINVGNSVYMVDYSLEPDDMMRLVNLTSKFVWCDHHKTALDKMDMEYPDYSCLVDGMQVDGVAACALTWKFLFPDHPIPRAADLIGMYDVWRLKEEPDALPFQYGIKTVKGIADPRSQVWAMLLSRDKVFADKRAHELLGVGRYIQNYQDECNAQICKRAAFETELRVNKTKSKDGLIIGDLVFDKYRAIACTSPMCNSMLFDSVWDPEKHDIMLSFYWDARGHWTVSVYSTKGGIDCGAIAKQFKGGGHVGAAGFQCSELPFKLNNKEA